MLPHRCVSLQRRLVSAGSRLLRARHASSSCRIGCSSGFWGDTAVAAPQLVHKGNIDFLVSDYLSEITMSLLAGAKAKVPSMGYAPDFVQSMGMLVKQIKAKGIKVVTNAGGINIASCAEAVAKIAKDNGVDLTIATVTGDDLMANLDEIRLSSSQDLDTGNSLPARVQSLNAYLGAFPIARALNHGADVVITGRCVDSALVLGPLIHKYGWKSDQLDLLAAGSLAGHLVECGAQATGGIFTDWQKVQGWSNIGFPIVECQSDGQFLLTKPPGTGGLVSFGTVAEQLVYEIGDPTQYVLPDVVCDFSQVSLEEGPDGVMVRGAKGRPPLPECKVSATYADGYRATAVCFVVGPDALGKVKKTAESIIERARGIFKATGMEDFSDVNMQILGGEDMYGPRRQEGLSPREAVLWLAVRHEDKRALQLFSGEIAPAGTGMAPGFTMLVGGRPRVAPVLRLHSFLYPKKNIKADICVNGQKVETYTPDIASEAQATASDAPVVGKAGTEKGEGLRGGSCTRPLSELAYIRSGDKGDTANIGVVARDPALFPCLKAALTEEHLQEVFGHLMQSKDGQAAQIKRYELPGVSGLNFVLPHSLGGGGIASLRFDPQGKAYAQMLADLEIDNVPVSK